VCREGEITWPPPPPQISAAPPKQAPAPAPEAPVKEEKKRSFVGPAIGMAVGALALLGLGSVAPPDFMAHFTVFVLACFVGYMVIWNVTAALHTPLMSVTNAISSIIVIGALLQISSETELIKWIAVGTVAITAVNIFGGFAVTRRMLEMFRK
jgi:NAD(P) transhydrogenase subunit alpha